MRFTELQDRYVLECRICGGSITIMKAEMPKHFIVVDTPTAVCRDCKIKNNAFKISEYDRMLKESAKYIESPPQGKNAVDHILSYL